MKIFDSGKFRFVSKSFESIYMGSYMSELCDIETYYNYKKNHIKVVIYDQFRTVKNFKLSICILDYKILISKQKSIKFCMFYQKPNTHSI